MIYKLKQLLSRINKLHKPIRYYLIDYENVSHKGFVKISHVFHINDNIIIFYSDNRKDIDFDTMRNLANKGVNISYNKVNFTASQALDFQLDTYLGYLIGNKGKEHEYIIVSNDKGFTVVANYWQSKNINVRCLQQNTQATSTPEPTVPLISPGIASQADVKALIGNQNNVPMITNFVNQYKSRVEISNALNKYFRDNKKSSEIYKKLKPLITALGKK